MVSGFTFQEKDKGVVLICTAETSTLCRKERALRCTENRFAIGFST
jgi:hypothetical protein